MASQKEFGARLSELRKRNGLTQAQVAEKLGTTNETLSRLERGVQWTEFAMLVKLAALYKADLADLFSIVQPGREAAKRRAVQEIVDLLHRQPESKVLLARDVLHALFQSGRIPRRTSKSHRD